MSVSLAAEADGAPAKMAAASTADPSRAVTFLEGVADAMRRASFYERCFTRGKGEVMVSLVFRSCKHTRQRLSGWLRLAGSAINVTGGRLGVNPG